MKWGQPLPHEALPLWTKKYAKGGWGGGEDRKQLTLLKTGDEKKA